MRTVNLRIVRNDGDMQIIGGKYATPGTAVEIAPCICIGQAWYSATRGRPDREHDVVIVRDHQGNEVPREEWPTCSLSPSHWTWKNHGFTHVATGIGHTDRIARAQQAEDARTARR